MPSKKPFSTSKSILMIFVVLLLPSVIAPAQSLAPTFKVLHTFHGPNGNGPAGGLVRDEAGNLYGTTGAGGTGTCGDHGCGTVFKLSKSGKQLWLHSFNGSNGEGPYAALIEDAAGNFYGTTAIGGISNSECGAFGCGVVFELNSKGQETVLYKFKKPPDGDEPESVLARDSAGNLYGVTQSGGKHGLGTIFKIEKNGEEKVLHTFTGGLDGCIPVGGLIMDAAGNLYGATAQGGSTVCDEGYGVVFEVDASGSFSVLYKVGHGAYPGSLLMLDDAGNLYGTTLQGGNSSECEFRGGCGVAFELSPQAGGKWTETVLYNFCSVAGCSDGHEPDSGPLVRDSEGNLYGTTIFGGTYRDCDGDGCGVVYKLDSAGQETVLYSFQGGPDGAVPEPGVVMDASGNLYGVTQVGGDPKCNPPNGCGTVFRITP
jgi:uncharacterized repeat protein (TIGR03803 family)